MATLARSRRLLNRARGISGASDGDRSAICLIAGPAITEIDFPHLQCGRPLMLGPHLARACFQALR